MLRAPSTPRAKGKGKAIQLSSPMVISESDALTRNAKPAKGNDSSSDEHKKMYGWFSLYLSASVSFLNFFSSSYSNETLVCLVHRPARDPSPPDRCACVASLFGFLFL